MSELANMQEIQILYHALYMLAPKCMVFLTVVRMTKLRKAHCSPPLVDEDNSMVFTTHSVPFPATRDLRSLVAGNGTS